MLTRDLLRYRVYRGKVTPRFVDLAAANLQELSAALLTTAAGAVGERRGDVEAALAEHAPADVEPLIVRGLTKLVVDRCEFAEAQADYTAQRMALFTQATHWLRQCPAQISLQDYAASLRHNVGNPADLYGDLPDNRPLAGFRDLTSTALLQRYNMAQVQGLVMASRSLEIQTSSRDVLRIRRVLRWLKFCRLVAELSRDDDLWKVQITGPATLFEHAKKYGLQLANFVPAVPLLGDYKLSAEIALRPGKVWQLEISQAAPLISPHAQRLGHVPEEIQQVASAFEKSSEKDGWMLDASVEPRHVGALGVMLPDLTFRHPDGRTVHVELFHRWHRGPLTQRIDHLASRADGEVLLGIDRALHKSAGLEAILQRHPRVNTFVFRDFPTSRSLRSALAAMPAT